MTAHLDDHSTDRLQQALRAAELEIARLRASQSVILSEFDRRQVAMDRVIKTLGLHPIKIVLHPEVSLTVTANVARSEEEAKLQAQGVDVTATDRDEEDQLEAEAVAELFEEEAQPVLTEEADEAQKDQEPTPESGDDEAGDGEKT